jgi:flagellar biosynthesis regulator FlbT
MIDSKKGIMILVYVLIFVCLTSFVSANLLTEILSPFETTNFSDIYNSYYSIIDFIIYSVLFIGLSQVTIGKRFESRGGKAVVVAIGLVLAIGLVISESYIGFNLRSFGPLAATIFIFLVGFVIFLGIKSAGMEVVGAASITLVITYFSIRSISPSFFDYMITNKYLSWLHSIILIAVLISAYKIFRLFFSKKDTAEQNNSDGFFKSISTKPKDFFNQIQEEKNEKDFIKKKLEKITNESGKDSKQIIKDLLELKKLIHEFGNSEKGKELIARKVESIIPKERQVHLKIQSIVEMVKRISNFEIQNFKNLQNNYEFLPESERKNVDKQLKVEWKKLDVEKQLLKLDVVIKKYDQSFRHHLEVLIVSLRSNKIKSSIKQVDEAIKTEKSFFVTLQQMEQLEKRLERFANREIKEMTKSD